MEEIWGLMTMEVVAPVLTMRDAVPVLPSFVPVTVCGPGMKAEQLSPVQSPSGEMLNVVVAVTSPRSLPYWSAPRAEYDWDPPAVIVEEAGDSTRWSRAAEFTSRKAVP